MDEAKLFEIQKEPLRNLIASILLGLTFVGILFFRGLSLLDENHKLRAIVIFVVLCFLFYQYVIMGFIRVKKRSKSIYIKVSEGEICIENKIIKKEEIKKIYIPEYDEYIEIEKINGKKVKILGSILLKNSLNELKKLLATYAH